MQIGGCCPHLTDRPGQLCIIGPLYVTCPLRDPALSVSSASIAGESLTSAVLLGCFVAAGGGVLLSMDGASTDSVANFAIGDGLLVAAALLWSIQTVLSSRLIGYLVYDVACGKFIAL